LAKTAQEVRILTAMKSQAKTVAAYLAELPEDRRAAIQAVRKVMLKHLPEGYAETMQYGMIAYVVPLSLYPAGYLNRKNEALPYAGLASQKNYMSVYLMSVYGDPSWFVKAYRTAGKKLDMGKGCVRFRKVEDLALDVIGQAVARIPVKKYITMCESPRKAG
jgi:hypothetical protein